MTDVGEHLGLIHHVAGALRVPGYLRDEAFSEGLVILAVADARYDPARRVPLAAYLALKLRWGLSGWLRREMRQLTVELDKTRTHSHEDAIQARRTLDRLVYAAARKLNANEYLALLGLAYGVRQNELASIMSKSPAQLEALRLSARAKLALGVEQMGLL